MRATKAESQAAVLEFVAEMKRRFPRAHIHPWVSPSGIGKYWVRIHAPDDQLLEALDEAADLSYDLTTQRGIDVFASGTVLGPNGEVVSED